MKAIIEADKKLIASLGVKPGPGTLHASDEAYKVFVNS